jgi:tryptophan 2,3-dioxygenase
MQGERPEPQPVRRMGRVTDDHEDHGLSYGTYLRIPDLISLQQLRSDPPAHDELLFIVVHQAYELWFRELVFELETARDRMFDGDMLGAIHLLQRTHAIEHILVEQVSVLETMTPQDFLAFRSKLTPASGFQSVQFREIEVVSGLQDHRVAEHLGEDEDERTRLKRRLEEPTLWDAFCNLMDANGLPMPSDDGEARLTSLVRMARDQGQLFDVSEALITHDELFAMWRLRHVLMVERQIGSKTGTGGSSGATYLRTTLDRRFYPELWELRSHL